MYRWCDSIYLSMYIVCVADYWLYVHQLQYAYKDGYGKVTVKFYVSVCVLYYHYILLLITL